MKKLITFCLFTALITVVFSVVLPVYAQQALEMLGATGEAAGIQAAYDLPSIVGMIISVALSLVGIVMIVLIIYGGFIWMTAAGEEKKVSKAKDILQAAIIGLIIVLAAYAITWFVVEKLLGATMSLT